MKDRLSDNFIVEVLAVVLAKRTMMDIIAPHMNFAYLQTEPQKKLWKKMLEKYSKNGRMYSLPQLQQEFVNDKAVIELLGEIEDIEVNEDGFENLIETFEKFVKQMKFLSANDKIVESYNRGDKEKSYDLLMQSAEEISHFSMKKAKYEAVFADFNSRQIKRKSIDWNFRFKIPTGIEELDYKLNGGPETGECVLWLGDSGAGKSTLLIHLGITAARQGYRVMHFQLEGTKEQCLNRYDACWSGTLYQDVKVGNIPENKLKASRRIIEKLCKKDIIVSSEETFSEKTLGGMRNECREVERIFGKIDMIIIDYLELAEPGDGHLYTPGEERFRQTKLARGCKMLAMEFNAVVHTGTQSNSIAPEELNDPSFVITRYNLSEDKGKIRPFDAFVTMNFTRDERKEQIMRLYTDKLRESSANDIIYICNNLALSRFYDRKRTLDMDWDDFKKIE